MRKCWLCYFMLCLIVGLATLPAKGQQTFPYQTDGAVDYPLFGASLLTTGVAIYLDRRVPPLKEADLPLLQVDVIPKIDRHVTRYNSLRAHQFSNVTGLTSMAAPFALLLDANNRRDGNGRTLMLVTLQGALLNNGLINLTKASVRRPRPFVYNTNVPLERKLTQNARYSFFSGHAAVSSYFAFAGAQMYHDLYPDSRHRSVVWASAAVLPLLTSYGRVRAGRHFVTDVLVGYGVGALIGILVPRLYRL